MRKRRVRPIGVAALVAVAAALGSAGCGEIRAGRMLQDAQARMIQIAFQPLQRAIARLAVDDHYLANGAQPGPHALDMGFEQGHRVASGQDDAHRQRVGR